MSKFPEFEGWVEMTIRHVTPACLEKEIERYGPDDFNMTGVFILGWLDRRSRLRKKSGLKLNPGAGWSGVLLEIVTATPWLNKYFEATDGGRRLDFRDTVSQAERTELERLVGSIYNPPIYS